MTVRGHECGEEGDGAGGGEGKMMYDKYSVTDPPFRSCGRETQGREVPGSKTSISFPFKGCNPLLFLARIKSFSRELL